MARGRLPWIGDPGENPCTLIRRLGKYELLDRIGAGGTAEAFLARVVGVGKFEKLVVVKILQRSLAEDSELLAQFMDEARLAASLSHANVVTTFDFGQVDGTWYLAMEFVEGRTLRYLQEVLGEHGKIGQPVAVHLVSQLCRGLEYAHSLKDPTGRHLQVVHRDVSPQNVMVSFGGDVKVLDFGIATFASRDFRTQVGIVKGKLRYMAPEQARGEALDRRTDLFSAGVILWELLFGVRPMPDLPDEELVEWVTLCKFDRPAGAAPLAPELETILARALHPEAGKRFPSCGELASALARYNSLRWPEFTQDELVRLLAEELGPEIRADEARIAALLSGTPSSGTRGDATEMDLPSAGSPFVVPASISIDARGAEGGEHAGSARGEESTASRDVPAAGGIRRLGGAIPPPMPAPMAPSAVARMLQEDSSDTPAAIHERTMPRAYEPKAPAASLAKPRGRTLPVLLAASFAMGIIGVAVGAAFHPFSTPTPTPAPTAIAAASTPLPLPSDTPAAIDTPAATPASTHATPVKTVARATPTAHAPTPLPTRVAHADTPAPTPTPMPSIVPTARPGKVSVSVDVATGWAEVWIDGHRVKSETPLIDYALSPGIHQVEVAKDGKRASKSVTVEAGQRLQVVLSLAQ